MIVSLPKFFELLSTRHKNQRLMGCDVGDKTIGLSLSDLTWQISSPLSVIHRQTFAKDLDPLVKAVEKYDIFALIVGYPVNLGGDIGPQAQKTQAFAEKVAEHVKLPIVLWDERMSTQAVNRILLTADLSRQRRKAVVDKAAATYILQGFLDFLYSQKRDLLKI